MGNKMDTKSIREVLIPSITTLEQGELVANAAELKAEELLVQTQLLEEDMLRLLGDVASRSTEQT